MPTRCGPTSELPGSSVCGIDAESMDNSITRVFGGPKGKERPLMPEVAERLFRRATGYEHKAVKIVADAKTGAEHQDEPSGDIRPTPRRVFFWLKNRRRPDLWRDRIDNTHSGPNGGPLCRRKHRHVRPASRGR